MKELGESCYNDNEYRKLFNIIIDSHICEDKAIGITNDGELLYIENKLMNNSSAYWVQSIFYSISKKGILRISGAGKVKRVYRRSNTKKAYNRRRIKKVERIEILKQRTVFQRFVEKLVTSILKCPLLKI